MATNNILIFCPDGTEEAGDLISLESYKTDSGRLRGHQPGIARRELENKALRQATYMAAALAQYIADTAGVEVTDSGTLASLVTALKTAITADGGSGSAGSATPGEVSSAIANHNADSGAHAAIIALINTALSGKMPKAVSGAGAVGQVVSISAGGTGPVTIPAGGTWLVHYWWIANDGQTQIGEQYFGWLAGGSTVWTYNGQVANFVGWAWRIV